MRRIKSSRATKGNKVAGSFEDFRFLVTALRLKMFETKNDCYNPAAMLKLA